MKKSVLMSFSPFWYYLIGEHIKGTEVRKVKPSDPNWNGIIECYMAKDKKSFAMIPDEFKPKYREHFGKVGMYFVCSEIDEFSVRCVPYSRTNALGYESFVDDGVYLIPTHRSTGQLDSGIVFERPDRYADTMLKNEDLKSMCLSPQQLYDYITLAKTGYGLEVKNLTFHEKPKQLGEFYSPCSVPEGKCKLCDGCYDREDYYGNHYAVKKLARPPQSFCYIEV